MNLHVRRTIQINDVVGVRINKTFHSLVKYAGGHENIPFCEKDVRNYINKECHAIGKEDLHDDFHVRNVFWADARSRAAYEYFGDVVTFDTTYLTNKYDIPFAALAGVNHHGQSTLLGWDYYQERIISLPEKYVLTRWKKNIKRKHSYIKTSYGVTELKPQMDRFDKLCKHFYEIAEVAANSEETTEDLHETLHPFSSNMSTKDSALIEENLNDDFNPINSNRIRNPKHVKRKGRPLSKRKTYVVEAIAKRSRKRTKKECNIGMVGSQFGSNICVESSLEVVRGKHYLDSSWKLYVIHGSFDNM
ncbi:hypothetical protein KIW84_042274 [Lathyrus oleraceus]|uniref:MULE transposase domain-containing protein n=1 Tax=Pisum sativum TaxID=3888 RepID=A0A9D4XCE1_PEA|nr:hypothetical protein KIW84_042274 [Pisum sativum]